MGVSDGTNEVLNGVMGGINSFADYFHSKIALDFIVYFVLGYYLATENISKRIRYVVYMLGIGAFMVIIFASPLRRLFVNETTDFDFGGGATQENINMLTLLYSVAVFVFAKYALMKKRTTPKIVRVMAKYSFGIYLTHNFFILNILYNFIYTQRLHSMSMFVLIPTFTTVVYLASLGVTFVFSKIPGLKKVV